MYYLNTPTCLAEDALAMAFLQFLCIFSVS